MAIAAVADVRVTVLATADDPLHRFGHVKFEGEP
jgi:hypothetical protein